MARKRRNAGHYGFANEETFAVAAILTSNPEFNTSVEDLYADAAEETKSQSRAQKVLAQLARDFFIQIITDDPDQRPTPVLRRRLAYISASKRVDWDQVSKYWITLYEAGKLTLE